MIVVKNKWTYLLLLLVPVALIKFIAFDFKSGSVIENAFVSFLIGFIGIYLFIKMNSHSNWLNPDHPKNKDEEQN